LNERLEKILGNVPRREFEKSVGPELAIRNAAEEAAATEFAILIKESVIENGRNLTKGEGEQ